MSATLTPLQAPRNVAAPFYDPVTGEVSMDELRRLPKDFPVGIPEIGVALGVRRQTVDAWRYRAEFPRAQPSTIGGRPWWKWGGIMKWAEDRRKGPFADPENKPLPVPEAGPQLIHKTRPRSAAAAMAEV